MNRLLEQLRTQHSELSAQYDEILNRCADENRDPSEAEAGILEGLRTQLEPLGDRIVQLRDLDERRFATMTALDAYPDMSGSSSSSGDGDAGGGAPVHTRSRLAPLVASDEQLRAVIAAVENRSAYSAAVVHERASIGTPAGSVAGPWVMPDTTTGREARFAEYLNGGGAEGNLVQYLAVVTPAVSPKVAEGAQKPDSGMVVDRRTANVDKHASWSAATWELLSDLANAVTLINGELMGSIVTAENAAIVAAITGDDGILTPALASTSRLVAVLELKQAIRAGASRGTADVVAINPLDYTSIVGELASTGQLVGGPAVAYDSDGTERLWGMRLVQTVGIAAGQALAGVGADATFWLRDGPILITDPYSLSGTNETKVIVEERAAVGATRPASWAYSALPAAGAPLNAGKGGGK
jgi:HK97 family phage major capsid protein